MKPDEIYIEDRGTGADDVMFMSMGFDTYGTLMRQVKSHECDSDILISLDEHVNPPFKVVWTLGFDDFSGVPTGVVMPCAVPKPLRHHGLMLRQLGKVEPMLQFSLRLGYPRTLHYIELISQTFPGLKISKLPGETKRMNTVIAVVDAAFPDETEHARNVIIDQFRIEKKKHRIQGLSSTSTMAGLSNFERDDLSWIGPEKEQAEAEVMGFAKKTEHTAGYECSDRNNYTPAALKS
eukprot:4565377-Karenia_brevis.AAC.1